MRGHNFEPKQYAQVTHCNHSHEMIWGIGPQGYHCSREFVILEVYLLDQTFFDVWTVEVCYFMLSIILTYLKCSIYDWSLIINRYHFTPIITFFDKFCYLKFI